MSTNQILLDGIKQYVDSYSKQLNIDPMIVAMWVGVISAPFMQDKDNIKMAKEEMEKNHPSLYSLITFLNQKVLQEDKE